MNWNKIKVLTKEPKATSLINYLKVKKTIWNILNLNTCYLQEEEMSLIINFKYSQNKINKFICVLKFNLNKYFRFF